MNKRAINPQKRKQGIRILERAFHIKLSPEQLNLIKFEDAPVMACACAGSGKTTMLLFKIMLDIYTNVTVPTCTLGLTFSKDAAKSMSDRYAKVLDTLYKQGVSISSFLGSPYFSTYHSWFLTSIEKVQREHPIKGHTVFENALCKALAYESQIESNGEQVSNIFSFYDYLINNEYSRDGIHILPSRESNYKYICQTQLQRFAKADANFKENYNSVVYEYNSLKKIFGDIDFGDMQTKLLHILRTNPSGRNTILNRTYCSQFVYVDEMQDTNPLQWRLINDLISPKAKKRIFTIGDDDQSIYSWRGSNPKIIINYKQDHPNAIIKHLSTNYRTGGNILQAVKPVIKLNKFRIPKKLQSGKPNQGHVYEFTSKPSNSLFGDLDPENHSNGYNAEHLLIKSIVNKIQDPNIDNNDIAILVRDNSSRVLITDMLANRGYYIEPSNRKSILQNKGDYKNYVYLIVALAHDSFYKMYAVSGKFGFTEYTKHIDQVLRTNGLNKPQRLSTYLEIAQDYDRGLAQKISSKQIKGSMDRHDEQQNIDYDNLLFQDLTYLRAHLHAHDDNKVLIRKAWQMVKGLNYNHHNYVVNKKFISVSMNREILNYVHRLILASNSVKGFLSSEYHKRRQLLQKLSDHNIAIGASPIHIMSIHQSKGLQFKYIYLFGIDDREVNNMDILIDKIFRPNLSLKNFIYILLHHRSDEIEDLNTMWNSHHPIEDRDELINLRSNIKSFAYDYCQDNSMPTNHLSDVQIVILLTSGKLLNNTAETQHILKKLRLILNQVNSLAFHTEEERRLIYVAFTRAISGLYFDSETSTSPLLKELDYHYIKKIH